MITLVSSDEALSKRDRDMLARAAKVAATSTIRHKHGAVIYKSGRVLSVGVNSIRNEHPTMEMNYEDYTYHAENAAFNGAIDLRGLAGATVYVVRINRAGKLMNSMPCRDCMRGLQQYRIKRIVYSV